MKLPWLRRKLEDPKTPDIKAASLRAKNSEQQANNELVTAQKLAEALMEIRQKNGLGESLTIIFGGKHGI